MGKSEKLLKRTHHCSYPDKDGKEEVGAELLHPLGSHLSVIAVLCLSLDGLLLHLDGRADTWEGDE